MGLEPTSSFEHRHLKPACLPVSSRPRRSDLNAGSSIICRQRRLVFAVLREERRTVRSAEEYNESTTVACGMNDCEIARRTGIPRRTICDWRRKCARLTRDTAEGCGATHDFGALPPRAYAYVLGMYLGGGCISRRTRSWILRITCDTHYPLIVSRCRAAIDSLMPGQRSNTVRRKGRCQDVYLVSKHWPCLLPQHGPGRKHHRRIALEPWQQALVDQATEESSAA